jgi:hypothetical protein
MLRVKAASDKSLSKVLFTALIFYQCFSTELLKMTVGLPPARNAHMSKNRRHLNWLYDDENQQFTTPSGSTVTLQEITPSAGPNRLPPRLSRTMVGRPARCAVIAGRVR